MFLVLTDINIAPSQCFLLHPIQEFHLLRAKHVFRFLINLFFVFRNSKVIFLISIN